jgi:protein-disulfide isomerase
LRCANCRTFSEEVFPRIAERYIETGEARFTVIPVAFIEGSKPLGNAALCVNHTSSDRFFPFIQELFRMDGSSKHEILRAARRAGGIDLHALGRCIDTREYYDELEENYHAAKRLMGRQFGTPALYVDGIPTSTASFEAVENRIAQLEKRR